MGNNFAKGRSPRTHCAGADALLGFALFASVSACGGKSATLAGASGAEPSGGGAGSGGSGGATAPDAGSPAGSGGEAPDSCVPGPEALVDVSVTPRALPNIEFLALKFSPKFVADQSVYTQLLADVSAIQTLDASIADITYRPPDDGRSLLISVDASTFDSMQSGAYHAWDCLNRELIVTNVQYSEFAASKFVVLTLKGIYNLKAVGALYAQLEGIVSVSPNLSGGDGSTICVTHEGSNWHYVFDRASGDCLAGCTEHSYLHFTTGGKGGVVALGRLDAAGLTAYANAEACR